MTTFRQLCIFLVLVALFNGTEGWSKIKRGASGSPKPLEFTEAFNLPTGISPYYVVAVDLNGDGYLDLVTSNTVSHSVTVFFNNGKGIYDGGTSYQTHGFTPYALAAGDVDGDGKPDLVCGNMFSVNFSIFFNKGDGTFRDAVTIKCDPGPMFPVISDLDNDGKPDIAICNIGHDDISIFINQGQGRFQHRATYPSKGVIPYSVIAADFDGDGLNDLATGNIYSSNISLLKNRGNALFAEAVTYQTDSLTQILYAADLNGDKRPDIVSGNGGSDNISVLINKGDGTFKPAVNYPVKLPQGVTVGDINDDGYPDIATANQSANSTSVLLNNGDGTFAHAVDFAVGGLYPTSIVIADLNNDGRKDLITANSGSNDVSILLNGVRVPKVVAVDPSASATVTLMRGEILKSITVKFNTTMDVKSLTSQTVRLQGSQSGIHPAKLSYSEATRTLEIKPERSGEQKNGTTTSSTYFQPGEEVKVLFTSAVQSVEGLKMKSGYVTSFSVQPEVGYRNFFAEEEIKNPAADHLVATDVDQDGRVDLIGLQDGSDSIAIYFNDAKGLFRQPMLLATGGFDPVETAVDDFNRDGRLDIVIANRLSSSISILYGEGGRRFSRPVVIQIAFAPVSLAAGDLDGDGSIDLAIANRLGKSISVLANQEGGKLQALPPISLDRVPTKIVIGDVDGDGLEDLVVVCPTSDSLLLYRNKGNETFLKKDELQLQPSNTRMILLRDLNEDGAIDIVAVNYDSNDVAVFINTGDGIYKKPYYIATNKHPTGGVLADVDANGLPDLIVSNNEGLTTFLNQGNGKFTKDPAVVQAGKGVPVAADFNGDGAIDLVNHHASYPALALFLNKPK